MNEHALRLLQLQEEFRNRASNIGDAKEFNKPEWMPRTEDAIAADYASTLRDFIATSN